MQWKPTLYMPLFAQENHVQRTMFDTTPEPKPPCEHDFKVQDATGTRCGRCGVELCPHTRSEVQGILGSPCQDVVCVSCGETIDHLEPCRACGELVPAMHGCEPCCLQCFDDEAPKVFPWLRPYLK